MARAWALISIAEGRQYGGNLGYRESPTSSYRYDSNVPNHLQLDRGDLVFVRDQSTVLGMARVESVARSQGSKIRMRCPKCGATQIKQRKHIVPKWRCPARHEFDQPATEEVPVSVFQATYGDSFVTLPDLIGVAELKRAALRPRAQQSIEELDVGKIADQIVSIGDAQADLLFRFLQAKQPQPDGDSPPTPGYTPSLTDTRDTIIRSIAARRGQGRFRNKLIRRYGPRCMITGCTLIDIVEAAHIWPYRGPEDNHVDNGLLLRADIHTLFDLDLLGIEPDSMRVSLHPDAAAAGYNSTIGNHLRTTGGARPSHDSLRARWCAFVRRSNPT